MRRVGSFLGIMLVLVGALLLLRALDILPVNVWGLIWPLLLIGLGLWIVWGFLSGRPSIRTQEVSIPLEGAQEARIRIRHGAGRLRVDANAGGGELVSGSFSGGLDHRVKRKGDALDVDMRVPAGIFPWMGGPWQALDWTVGLNKEIPLALRFETGASDMQLDLTHLHVTNLRLETGASSTSVKLPAEAGHTDAHISCGAASVVIRVPSDVAARVRIEGALTGIEADETRFPRSGRVYQSPDYASAPNKVDLHIEAGVGSIEVR